MTQRKKKIENEFKMLFNKLNLFQHIVPKWKICITFILKRLKKTLFVIDR